MTTSCNVMCDRGLILSYHGDLSIFIIDGKVISQLKRRKQKEVIFFLSKFTDTLTATHGSADGSQDKNPFCKDLHTGYYSPLNVFTA